MNRFLEVVPLAFTPLTPIHIGCGEDFEPTNYIIHEGVLYHFDPARLSLDAKARQLLIQCANREGHEAIGAVQRFMYERSAECRKASRLAIPVAIGVSEWYQARVGKVSQREAGGRAVRSQLEIERTAHHPGSGEPYLPGSSLKGSMRTGWLNHVDRDPITPLDPEWRPAQKGANVEAELLGGAFHSDPFRFVDVADTRGSNVRSRVIFAVDRDKKPPSDTRRGEKNLFVRRQVISPAQHRVLTGEIRFERPPSGADAARLPRSDKRIPGFRDLARACNGFYCARLQSDLDLVERRFGDNDWLSRFRILLRELETDFDEGRVLLLRVGRHSGAESVTLEKRRAIRIKGGKRRGAFWSREATTMWLAAERESSLTKLLPFGWLLAEPADSPPNAALRLWCETESGALVATADQQESEIRNRQVQTVEQSVEIWDRARLRFNAANGTLTAIGPKEVEAHALAPRGAELLSGLPPDVQTKVRLNQFIRVVARVRGRELIAIEARST